MGYTTEFSGRFKLNRKLYPTHALYLKRFAEIRHMRRDVGVIADGSLRLIPDWQGAPIPSTPRMALFNAAVEHSEQLRKAVGLPMGMEGAYFLGDESYYGQTKDNSILDYNTEPRGVPGLWCKWVPTEDGLGIEWNGHEKFYDYVKWLEYLIEHFLKPWGYVVSGIVTFQGEEPDDHGSIEVVDNVVRVVR